MKKLATICLILMVALGLLGLGYAHWTKTLSVKGTVNTGTVKAEFREAFTDDDEVVNDTTKDSLDDGLDPAASGPDPKPRYDKNVGSCSASVNATDNQKATFEMVNAYPSYHNTAWFLIHYSGSVPAHISGVRVNGVSVTPCVPTPFDLSGDGVADVTIHVTGIEICQQLHYCDLVWLDLDVHVLQDAPQGATMTFDVEVDLTQWNMPAGG